MEPVALVLFSSGVISEWGTWIESAKETKLRELSFHGARAGMEFGLGDTALPVQPHMSGPKGLRGAPRRAAETWNARGSIHRSCTGHFVPI